MLAYFWLLIIIQIISNARLRSKKATIMLEMVYVRATWCVIDTDVATIIDNRLLASKKE
jgi:DNA-binding sugar fermentation-stimulating protein